MEDLSLVEGLEATDDLNENVPDLLFLDVGLSLLVTTYFLEHVAIVRILHHQAE